MNRPNKENYLIYDVACNYPIGFDTDNYLEDIEKYCDELEKDNIKLEKALDRVCDLLWGYYKSKIVELPHDGVCNMQYSKQEIKEDLMSNEYEPPTHYSGGICNGFYED